MTELGTRLQRAIDELTGNEALLEMLETDAAIEMLDWGKEMAAVVMEQTEGPDEIAAEEAAVPRLKAVRQAMRTIGNWAAGKYEDPASRAPLRDKLLGYFLVIFGEDTTLPAPSEMDAILGQVDDKQGSPHQLIGKLKQLFDDTRSGDMNVETT